MKKYIAIIKTAQLDRLSTALQSREFYQRFPTIYKGEAEKAAEEVNAIYEQFPFEELGAAINDAEKRARTRCISPHDVIKALLKLHEKGMHGTPFAGVSVSLNPKAQEFPHAYRGTPESTWVCAVYDGTAWKITEICRAICTRSPYGITWTERAKQAVIDNF